LIDLQFLVSLVHESERHDPIRALNDRSSRRAHR